MDEIPENRTSVRIYDGNIGEEEDFSENGLETEPSSMEGGEEKEGKEEEEEEEPATVPLDMSWFVTTAPVDVVFEVLLTIPVRRIRALCATSNAIRTFCSEHIDKYFWLAMWESDTRALRERNIKDYRESGGDPNKLVHLLSTVEVLAEIIYQNPEWAPHWVTPELSFPTLEKGKVEWVDHPEIKKIWEEEPEEVTDTEWSTWLRYSTRVQAFARFYALLAEPRFVVPVLGNDLVLLVDREGDFWEKRNAEDPKDDVNYVKKPIPGPVVFDSQWSIHDTQSDPGPEKKAIKASPGIDIGSNGEEDVVASYETWMLMEGNYRWTRIKPELIRTPPWEVGRREVGTVWLGYDMHVSHDDDLPEKEKVRGLASDVFYFVGDPTEDVGARDVFVDDVTSDSRTAGFLKWDWNEIPDVLFQSGSVPYPQVVREMTNQIISNLRIMMLVPGTWEGGTPIERSRTRKEDSAVLYDTRNVGSRLVDGEKKIAKKSMVYFLRVGIRPLTDGDAVFVSYKKIMRSETGNVFFYFDVLINYVVDKKRGGYRFVNAQVEPTRMKFSIRDFVDKIYTSDFEAKHVIDRKDRRETWNRFRTLSETLSTDTDTFGSAGTPNGVSSLSDIRRDASRIRDNK